MTRGRSTGWATYLLLLGMTLVGCGSAANTAPADTGAETTRSNTGVDGGDSQSGADSGDTDFLTLVDPAEAPDAGDAAIPDEATGSDANTNAVEEPEGDGAPSGDSIGPADAGGAEHPTVGGGSPGTPAVGGAEPDPPAEGDVGEPLSEDGRATQEQVLNVLRGLPPLSKYTYSAPSVIAYLPEWTDISRELVRITRTSGIAGAYTLSMARKAIQAAIAADQAEPDALPVALNVFWAPWLVEYKLNPHEVTDFGDEYVSGLDRMRTFFGNLRTWIDDANAEFGSNVQLKYVHLEIEVWQVSVYDPVGAAALLRRHNECYDLVKEYFPEATVNWFGRGAVGAGANPAGLIVNDVNSRYTHEERGDCCSTLLYGVGNGQQETLSEMRDSIENCDTQYGPENDVVPFIALAAGYRFTVTSPYSKQWSRNWDYRVINSYQLGMFIYRPEYSNNWYNVELGADWNRAPAVEFFPPLVDHKLSMPDVLNVRLKHFVAYCCGATNTPFPLELWPDAD